MNPLHEPFFISLVVTVWILHNCKLDSEDAMNVMALEVPKKMDLKTSRPYRNVCEFDSREIPSVGLIKNLQIHPTAYPNVFIIIDIVVLDIRATRECCCHANGHQIGHIQINFSYTTILTPFVDTIILYKEPFSENHVEAQGNLRTISLVWRKAWDHTLYL